MQSIHKTVLDNGLTILIHPVATIPKVAIQLWYNVGSKDEKDGQRGLAHLLEHMIFKGTNLLSESDITMIAHKLSGNCNAFTSHDYTAYLFDLPKQNWEVALPLLANCMRECTFKEDLLNAELKAVIQELKMYKDDYYTSLCEEMLAAIFTQHPYHYPIIGYKQDLWSITRQGLLSFYKQHYIPNNATLVIVGDVSADDAFEQAQKAFGSIAADRAYKKEIHTYVPDILAQTVTLRRDIQQPLLMYAWVVPGLRENQNHVMEAARWILGEGKGSRLYKKLIDEQALATDIQVDLYELFDQSVLFVHIDPVDEAAMPTIEKIIAEEVKRLHIEDVSEQEFQRARKLSHMEHLGVFENNQKMAYEIGQAFLATGSENTIFEFAARIDANKPFGSMERGARVERLPFEQGFLRQFFKKNITLSRMHKGIILPLTEAQRAEWLALQEESDKQDAVILSRKVRESVVECGVFVEQVTVNEAARFTYPHAQKSVLSNGLSVLWHPAKQTPKIDIILDFKAAPYYDPENAQGLVNFMSEMMLEGTQDYTDEQLAAAAESRGISIDVRAGTLCMSMLMQELEFALELLAQIVTKATFPEKNIEKIRTQILAEITHFWDSPAEFAGQLARTAVYDGHPYHKNTLGDAKMVKKIKCADIVDAYHAWISPDGARLAIVGDLAGIDVMGMLESALHRWKGQKVPDILFPSLQPIHARTIDYPINRDQIVLSYAGQSVTRLDKNFDALLLFDQMFSGGVLGSMSSYLFQLREQTGLFYTIGGSLVAHADEQPGMVYIRTIVSPDRAGEAERLIEGAIAAAKDKIASADLEHARNALVNAMVDNFESNSATAQAFLFLDRFAFPADYFDTRLQQLKTISIDDIKHAVSQVLDLNKLVKIRVGRK